MSVTTYDLQSLSNTLVNELHVYGLQEISIEQYRNVCGKICSFAFSHGSSQYSSTIMDEYTTYLDDQFQRHSISQGYHRFQKRVIYLLSSLAEHGQVNFLPVRKIPLKYPVSDEIHLLIEDILTENHVSDTVRPSLLAPMRHLFWYASQQGCEGYMLDDSVIMRYIVREIPATNSGSTGRTLRCVKYITEYLRSHEITALKHDYTMLKLKNAPVRIIPAFSEEEIRDISSAIDTRSPLGMRNHAIVLLAYGTGLRGADIANLKLADIDWRQQKARLLQGKNHAPLVVELNGSIMNSLADYALLARPECRVPEFFVTSNAPYRKLTPKFASMIDQYCQIAKVKKIPRRAFHSFRRSFETVLAAKGTPIETVSRMVGHKHLREDKPYITYDKEQALLIAMDFSDVPIRHGIYAGHGSTSESGEGGASA